MSDDNKPEILDDEKDLVLDHDYDGIQELDHPLPFWWVAIFGLSIAFSIPYYVYYVHFGGPSQKVEFREKVAHIKKQQADYEAQKGGFNTELYNAFTKTAEGKKLGEKVYKAKCLACHADKGQGLIGPNLTDDYWIHGKGDLAGVSKSISKGILKKGMPAWEKTLDEKELLSVIKYVMDMKGKNIPGKEPQGELIQ